MKKIFFTIAGLVTILYGEVAAAADPGGGRQLPNKIAVSFDSRYPQAHRKGWEMQQDLCKIDFVNDRRKSSAWYTADGQWVRTEVKIPWMKDLPQQVRNSVDRSPYTSWYVDNIREEISGKGILYVLHVDDGNSLDSDHYDAFRKDRILSYTADGTLMSMR
jgi:hypothetical protein